ncbi:MAG TPA: DUF5995 family protein [Pyrinomonadaceae bacterium]
MPPRTIEEVIARLEEIIDDALRREHRIGYFGALYERVTTNVRRALVAGDVFQDNPRMERLDVVFAARVAAWLHTSECKDIRTNIQIIAE